MEKEDGEMSDDNAMFVDDDVKEETSKEQYDHTVLYKAAKNGILVEKLERVDAAKLEERAKRFGLNLAGGRVVTQKQIDELYERAGINGNERHFRFDTIHLNGIEELTTRDIFEYLEDYKPVAMEKIDDVSCNIVCQDHIAAALALLVHSREIRNEHINEMLREKSQHHWREGMPHPKKDLILMRFATNADKKMPKNKHRREVEQLPEENFDQSMDPVSKNPWGDLCRSWGVYDHQEVFQRRFPPKHDYEEDVEEPVKHIQIRNKKLALRLGKRRQVEESDDSDSDSKWRKKSKTLRMRMHADDEESKLKKIPITGLSDEEDGNYEKTSKFAPLSIEVANSQNDSQYVSRETTILSDKFKRHEKSHPKKGNVQSRLGFKVAVDVEKDFSDEASSNDSDHYVSSKVHRVQSATKSSSSVWSRLENIRDADESDLRQVLKSKKGKSDDLRDRLSKAKKSNLRIEIDNC